MKNQIILDQKKQKKDFENELPQPKQFEIKRVTLSSKLEGRVKVKKSTQELVYEGDQIKLQKGEYIKLIGITSIDRTPLYCSNENFFYLLELSNNLDYIATSILGGKLDRMLLITKNNEKEKCQWYVKDSIIYIIYGSFPDKKGKWLLENMSNNFTELVNSKDVNNLSKLEKYKIQKAFELRQKFLLKEYLKMQDIFSEQDIPYVEDQIRLHYIGLSSKSIGVISLLIGEELNVEIPAEFDNKEEELEMKESVLTAKIEAIAANTMGNTLAMPKWIIVKLGFQNYRFLTFQKYENDYFLYALSEGNLGKISKLETTLRPLIEQVTDKPFSGNLASYNKLKLTLKEFFNEKRIF